MKETINEERKEKPKMSVKEMSKKVFVGAIILLIVLSIVDIVKSNNNGIKPWIGRYMDVHYPDLFSGLFSVTEVDYAAQAVKEAVSAEKPFEEERDGYPFYSLRV